MTTPPRPVPAAPAWPAVAPAPAPRPPAKTDARQDFRAAVRQQANKLGRDADASAAGDAAMATLSAWLGETAPGTPWTRDAGERIESDNESRGAPADAQGGAPDRQAHPVTPEVDASPGHDSLADHTAAALAEQLNAVQGMGCFAVQLPGAGRVDVIYDLTPERARLYLRAHPAGIAQGPLDAASLARRIGAQCGKTVEVLCV